MPDLNVMMARAHRIGNDLATEFPPVDRAIPAEAVTTIADTITLIVAEILQSWIDAGSERDVTMEELGPAIEAHVRGWVYSDASDGA